MGFPASFLSKLGFDPVMEPEREGARSRLAPWKDCGEYQVHIDLTSMRSGGRERGDPRAQ